MDEVLFDIINFGHIGTLVCHFCGHTQDYFPSKISFNMTFSLCGAWASLWTTLMLTLMHVCFFQRSSIRTMLLKLFIISLDNNVFCLEGVEEIFVSFEEVEMC